MSRRWLNLRDGEGPEEKISLRPWCCSDAVPQPWAAPGVAAAAAAHPRSSADATLRRADMGSAPPQGHEHDADSLPSYGLGIRVACRLCVRAPDVWGRAG